MSTSSNAKHKHFFFAVSSGVVVSIVRVLTSIVIIPFMLAHLDKNTFSLYVFFIGIVDLFLLLDVVSGGVIRLSAELRARKNEQEARQLLSAGHLIVLVLSVTALTLGWWISPSLLGFINLPLALAPLALLAVKTTLLENVMQFYLSFHQSSLRFQHRNYWSNIADIIFSLGNCAAVFLLIGQGFGLETVFLVRVALGIVRFCVILINSYRVEPVAFGLRPGIRKETFKQLWFYMTYNALTNGSSLLSSRLDNFLIANLSRLNLVGLNDILGRFLGPIFIISGKIMENISPIFFRLNAEEKHDRVRLLFLRISAYMSFMTVTFLLAVLIFTPLLLHRFTSGKFEVTFIVWLALIFKALCLWTIILAIPATQYLYARNLHRFVVVSNLVTSVATFSLSLLLTPRINIAGVALAALIPAAVNAHFFTLPKVRSGLGVSGAEYRNQVFMSLLPTLALQAILLFLLKMLCYWAPYPLLIGAFGCLAVFVLSALLWFKQTATPYEIAIFNDLLGKYQRQPKLSSLTEIVD